MFLCTSRLDIQFTDRKLGKDINDKKRLLRRFGDQQASLLMRRMAQLSAAPSLATFHPPYSGPARCHELTGNKKGVLSIDLKHPYRLLIEPTDDPPPTREEGGLDWSAVTAIKIIGIEDTHG